MTSLTQNAAAVEAAMAYTGTTPFGLGGGSIFGPPDLYRLPGLAPPQRASTATTPPASTGTTKFHQHRSPFAIQQLLGLGQDKKSSSEPMLSTRREDFPQLNDTKTKEFRDYRDKIR